MGKKAVEIVKKRAAIGSYQVQVEIIMHPGDGLHERCLVSIPGGRHWTSESDTRNFRKSWEPLPLTLQLDGGSGGDRRRVQPTAHHHPDPCSTTQMIADDAVK